MKIKTPKAEIKNLISVHYDYSEPDGVIYCVNEVLENYGLEIIDLTEEEYESVDDNISVFYKLAEIEEE